MYHDIHIEWGLNAKAYFETYRGLCKLRKAFAYQKYKQFSEDARKSSNGLDLDKAKFWFNVHQYWKNKFNDTYRREDEYFGH